MKTHLIILCLMFILSCTTDDFLQEKRSEETRIPSSTSSHAQYGESDFNFLLRAVHPSQNIDIRFNDGSRKARFQSTIHVWKDGKVRGHAKVRSKQGWDLAVGKKITRCEDDKRIVELTADVKIKDRSGDIITEEWIIILQSSSSDTDNPDCLIWDIKDSDGNSQAQFQPEGKIYIDNKACSIR